MKNLQTFNEFINESELNEGSLSVKGANYLIDGVDVLIDDFDQEVEDLHIGICDILGEDPSNVFRVDSESNDENPTTKKIYRYLESNLNGSSVDTSKFYDLSTGEDVTFDKKLNVIRYDDHGFVAFFFTPDSKF